MELAVRNARGERGNIGRLKFEEEKARNEKFRERGGRGCLFGFLFSGNVCRIFSGIGLKRRSLV